MTLAGPETPCFRDMTRQPQPKASHPSDSRGQNHSAIPPGIPTRGLARQRKGSHLTEATTMSRGFFLNSVSSLRGLFMTTGGPRRLPTPSAPKRHLFSAPYSHNNCPTSTPVPRQALKKPPHPHPAPTEGQSAPLLDEKIWSTSSQNPERVFPRRSLGLVSRGASSLPWWGLPLVLL